MLTEKSAKTPMYQFIMDDIKGKIAEGILKPHDPLPTQIDLARQYNTSEITSRRALSDLVQEGYIYRVRGKGSFVKENAAETSPKAISTIYFAQRNMDVQLYNHRFFADTLAGIKEVCEENGTPFYLWDIGPNYELPDDPNAGIVLASDDQFDLTQLIKWRDEGRRIVTVHFYYPHLNIPYVIVDNLTGGYLATQHLLSLGHERIGIILTGASMVEMNQEFSLRLQGYRLALSQHQIPFDPELVCVMDNDKEKPEMGYEGFKTLMSKKDRPTAIFATSDYKAFGAINAAREMGISVPEDMSIVGYDDLVMSQYTYPNLTTVNQNTKKLGERAAEMLLFELQESQGKTLKDEIVPRLIVRDSCAEAKE
ncbi:GntR family transcriptional regulator [Paenibacillus spongiae]|uniref:GntR family transcriptional regulator n=1 Tax=Paenibacillus spongiae TaxID=2909671 RepID=A0ABY5SAQ5_9BACL|nr:GntR family transcriptional regulator [Paenibacillus spongiae]UVI29610.1 GntR family transcriptional regulator [Paenibacillus spongiae]